MIETEHPWLRRVSDYHSGGVSEAERVAVETHIATCAICQAALEDYRRLYSLARSPLRLGAPSLVVMRRPMRRSSYEPRFGPSSQRSMRGQRRAYLGVAAAVAAAIIVAGFLAVFGARLRSTGPAATPTASAQPSVTTSVTPSPFPSPLATISVGPTATLAPFVCANPSGSSAVYAYTDADGQVYGVNGCAAPQQLTHEARAANGLPRFSTAIAWSPSNRYLAILGPASDQPPYQSAVEIADTQTGTLTQTQYHLVNITPTRAANREFIGWLDDATFLGAVTQNELTAPSPVESVRVNAQTQAETHVATLMYAAKLEVRGGALFYGGYASASESQQGAHLHRVDLATGADTTLVSLGAFGDGGCQVYGPCNATTPWDVTPDGQHVVFHNPGAASASSEVGNAPDTPLYYANLDGSQAVRLFADVHAPSLQAPIISPDGTQVLYCCAGTNTNPGGVVTNVQGGGERALPGTALEWRGDSRGIVVGGASSPQLVNIVDGSTKQLSEGTLMYVWST